MKNQRCQIAKSLLVRQGFAGVMRMICKKKFCWDFVGHKMSNYSGWKIWRVIIRAEGFRYIWRANVNISIMSVHESLKFMQIKKYLSGLVGVEQSKGSAVFYQPHTVIATIRLDVS